MDIVDASVVAEVTDARLLERIQGRAIRGIGVEPDIVYQRPPRCGDVFCADVILEVFVVVLQDERQSHAIARCIDAQIARLVNVKPRSLVQQPLGILRRVRFSLEARQIDASNGKLIAEVTGEVEKEEGVLVIRRIHVDMRLTAPEEVRETVERVHGLYAMRCPLYRTLHNAIQLTSSYTLVASVAQA